MWFTDALTILDHWRIEGLKCFTVYGAKNVLFHKAIQFHMQWNVTPLRSGSNFFSLEHFIAPSLNWMPCLSSWLEIISSLHSQGMREEIRVVISVWAYSLKWFQGGKFTSPAWKLTSPAWNACFFSQVRWKKERRKEEEDSINFCNFLLSPQRLKCMA